MAITYCRTKSFEIKQGEKTYKVEQFGIKTTESVMPFGDDSSIPEGYTAIYLDTENVGDKVIIGCINKNQIAKSGEKRIFSIKPDKSLSIDIYLRDDGKAQIGGNVDNLVRYSSLNTALQQEKNLINIELNKIAVAMNAIVPGSYSPGLITLDILQSKIEELLCP